MTVACFSVLCFRICVLSFGDSRKNSNFVDNAYNINSANIKRPDILDRNGMVLATNLVTHSLYANPKKIVNVEKAATQIVEVFRDIDVQKISKILKSDRSFVWIRKHLTPKEQIQINNLGIPGLYFIRDNKRIYPHEELFSHVVGYVGVDQEPLAGMELYLGKGKDIGENLVLSLETKVQSVIRNKLNQMLQQYNAKGASGVVMNVKDGQVISLVSVPDFNPNVLSKTDDNSRFNRATLGVYEMGSTFKIFTMAAALDSGVISITDAFNVSESIMISGYKIKDLYPTSEKITTISNVFGRSSNIGMSKIALKLGSDLQREYMNKFGLTSALRVEVPEKSSPVLPRVWKSDIAVATLSYGYGIAVTLLHTVQAAAATINGGLMCYATYLKDIDKSNCSRVISEDTSGKMRHLMEFVVKNGTGKRADAPGYNVGGKTGSAEKSIDGGYRDKKNIVSFIAAFPIQDPKYIIGIMVDEPVAPEESNTKAVTAGIVVAPAIKEIISRIGPILNISPEIL